MVGGVGLIFNSDRSYRLCQGWGEKIKITELSVFRKTGRFIIKTQKLIIKKMETRKMSYIEIVWEGPYSLKEVLENKKIADKNFGLYQIYGDHAVYGRDTLLYIGKTKRDIAERFREHSSWLPYEQLSAKIHLGRLGDNKQEKTGRDKMIGMAERLLIYYCAPSYNAKGIGYDSIKGIVDLIVLNYGNKAMLPYELSTLYEDSEYAQEFSKMTYTEILGITK